MLLENEIAQHDTSVVSNYGLGHHGLADLGYQHWNLHTPQLYEQAIIRNEGVLAHLGALVVSTGSHTGRSPNDKFIVRQPDSEKNIWWGSVNHPLSEENFNHLYERILAYFCGKEVFVQDCYVGADMNYRLPIRIVSETAWHTLFARTMFIRPVDQDLEAHQPAYTILHAPHFKARPEIDGTASSTFIVLDLGRKLVLIGGTEYAGEIKKAVFSIMNYILPLEGVLPMHCSANYGRSKNNVALFFGLSGTGKTTLSADPHRTLIGDDEHGWSDDGVFNFEGGCYAKVIHLDRQREPEIYETTRRFGTILENVIVNEDRTLNLDDDTLTENTRAAYPITHIHNADLAGVAGHPKNIIFLTADAFGVLPAIARLSPEQAMYHFLSGYTAKIAGTERGIGTEPCATFSACFGAPFLPLHPVVYTDLLRAKLQRFKTNVWLINTGWSGGPYGIGRRIKLPYTRAMISAILNGELSTASYVMDPIFGLAVPLHIPDVPDETLNQRKTWDSPASYDAKARELAYQFKENFKKYADRAGRELESGGPIA